MLLFVNSVADILFLLFIATLFSIYLAAITDTMARRLGLSRGFGLLIALLLTFVMVGAVSLLIVPPVVIQFQELIGSLPGYVAAWEVELARLQGVEEALALTPAMPMPLLVRAAISPATWVPCPTSSQGSGRPATKSQPIRSST